MKISSQQLINLSVETQSGDKLGTIESFNIDIDSQSILEYKIKPTSLVKKLIQDKLIIPRGQVVDIQLDKIIVNNIFSKKEAFKKLNKISAKNKQPVTINKE